MKRRIKLKSLIGPAMAISILCVAIDSNADLQIRYLRGDVAVNKAKVGGHTAQRYEKIKNNDILSIPKGGVVKIHDSKTKGLYKNISHGDISAGNLIAMAMDNSIINVKTVNDSIWDVIKRNGNSQKKTYEKRGVSFHKTHDIVTQPVDLPEGMSYLSYLMSIKNENQHDVMGDYIGLRREYVSDDYSEFYFSVWNDLDSVVYVNVIDQHPEIEDDIRFYFDENPIAEPCTITAVRNYEFYSPEPGGFIIIASEKNFTIEDVKRLLDSEYHPKENYYFSILIPDNAAEE